MTQNAIISEVKASGEEIFQITSAIEHMTEGISKPSLLISLLALALSIQYPDISNEDRVEGVHDISRYICLWVDGKLERNDNLSVN